MSGVDLSQMLNAWFSFHRLNFACLAVNCEILNGLSIRNFINFWQKQLHFSVILLNSKSLRSAKTAFVSLCYDSPSNIPLLLYDQEVPVISHGSVHHNGNHGALCSHLRQSSNVCFWWSGPVHLLHIHGIHPVLFPSCYHFCNFWWVRRFLFLALRGILNSYAQ